MPQLTSFDLRVPLPPAGDAPPGRELAASVYLPDESALAGRPPVLVLLPGNGYSRRYFDLDGPGFSQARHHAASGAVVFAIDHLGTGDSSLPEPAATLAETAAADDAAVNVLVGRLRAGTLDADLPPVSPAAVIGAGHSLGGHILAAVQGRHRTFDGVAVIGASMTCAPIPLRPGTPVPVIPDGTPPEQAALIALGSIDFNWLYHWEEFSAAEAGPDADELASLIAADIAAGLPMRTSAPPWGTLAVPAFGYDMMQPGLMAAEASGIDVPVLIAAGERDGCHPLAGEAAAYATATDISLFTLARSAHMYNFAVTRAVLWNRLDEFVGYVTRARARSRGE